MEFDSKKRAISLGARVGFVFLAAVAVVILVAYYVLSQNFHNLLSDYTIKLIQSMVEQGVETVEFQLASEQKEITVLADSFDAPASGNQAVEFPSLFYEDDELRMIYVADTWSVASDGRQRDIRNRPDITAAFGGETSVYGPYFNEEGEFAVCYSAPVRDNDRVVGVLSVEKDGYRFSELIENIRFVNSGESYIISAEGTDIAVSNEEHMEWVTSEYNARKLYEAQADETTKSILELEQNGLDGETGVGSYYWDNGLCYVVYEPIPSVGWVLLTGIREEEISAMTQSALFLSVSRGPILAICLALLLFLTGLIIFWIFSNMKKTAEINEKLEIIANHDSLTGLLNRRFLETSLSKLWKYPIKVSGQAAIFMMDIDNFKNYNDLYGHPQGDDCLRHVAAIFEKGFEGREGNVIRYGGEEFIAVIFLIDRELALTLGEKICRMVEAERIPNGSADIVTVSVGVCHVSTTLDSSLFDCIQLADQALYRAKADGKNRAVLFDAPQKNGDATAGDSN